MSGRRAVVSGSIPRTGPASAIALLVAAALLLAGCSGDPAFDVADVDPASGPSAADADFRFVIPAGTGEAIDAGEPVEIIPADLTVNVGDMLELVNRDDRGHTVGPFFVGANETLRQQFTSPGVYEGLCTVHPSGQVVLTVVDG
jgi:plastocyanin